MYSGDIVTSFEHYNRHGKLLYTAELEYKEDIGEGTLRLKEMRRNIVFLKTFSFDKSTDTIKIRHLDESGQAHDQYGYILNKNSQLVGWSSQDPNGFDFYEKYYLNKRGYPVSTEKFLSGKKIGADTFSYEYDEIGNWIKRTRSSSEEDGKEKVVQIVSRTIKYVTEK